MRRACNLGSEHETNCIVVKLFCRTRVARATARRCLLGVGRIVPSAAVGARIGRQKQVTFIAYDIFPLLPYHVIYQYVLTNSVNRMYITWVYC